MRIYVINRNICCLTSTSPYPNVTFITTELARHNKEFGWNVRIHTKNQRKKYSFIT